MDTARQTLEHALEAHGGAERWKKVQRLETNWSFHGMMFKLRLREGQLQNLKARIWAQKPYVEVDSYLSKGTTSSFAPTNVEIHNADGTVRSRENIRKTFGGLRTLLWWDDFEMLYFAGYVLWNYAQLPFLLTFPGIELGDCTPHQENGEAWSRLSVLFPADLPAHSREQAFYFDNSGLLRRHDYYVAIMSPLARGARYIHAYADVDGFKLPSRIEIKLRGAGTNYIQQPALGFVDFDNMAVHST